MKATLALSKLINIFGLAYLVIPASHHQKQQLFFWYRLSWSVKAGTGFTACQEGSTVAHVTRNKRTGIFCTISSVSTVVK